MVWDSRDEDWGRFIAMPREIAQHAPFLPEIYSSDARRGLILEEDLGERPLHRVASRARTQKTLFDAYRRVLDALHAWQSLDARASPSVASRTMDEGIFLWETDYFARRCVADFCGCGSALGSGWESERRALARAAASLPVTLLHRDFQSENIIFAGSGVRFVDFQGARLGPPAYDLASLLYDPYVPGLTGTLRERLLDYYGSLDLKIKVTRRDFDLCAAQRLMQACGAYGNLSVHKGKKRYRKFMPVALRRLSRVMERLPEYPEINSVVKRCRGATGR